MSNFTVKQLKEVLEYASDEIPVKVHCSFNQYQVKRIALYKGTLIVDVGDVENPLEEYEGPSIA